MIQRARQSPMWPGLKAAAPSLAHDDAVMGDGLLPRDRLAAVSVPLLAVVGGASPEWMRRSCRDIADAVPGGAYRVLEGQTHMVEPEVLGPVLADFFAG